MSLHRGRSGDRQVDHSVFGRNQGCMVVVDQLCSEIMHSGHYIGPCVAGIGSWVIRAGSSECGLAWRGRDSNIHEVMYVALAITFATPRICSSESDHRLEPVQTRMTSPADDTPSSLGGRQLEPHFLYILRYYKGLYGAK